MSLLTDLKQRLYQRRRKAASVAPNRVPQGQAPLNLETAREIIILFPADSADERKVVDKWKDNHRVVRGKIRLYGYFSTDIGGSDFGCEAITVKDLNWYGIPGGEAVNHFQADACDLLIRLGPPEHPVLDYLAATKAAVLRVGPFLPTGGAPYNLQFDGQRNTAFQQQLAAIEQIFSFTNATATT